MHSSISILSFISCVHSFTNPAIDRSIPPSLYPSIHPFIHHSLLFSPPSALAVFLKLLHSFIHSFIHSFLTRSFRSRSVSSDRRCSCSATSSTPPPSDSPPRRVAFCRRSSSSLSRRRRIPASWELRIGKSSAGMLSRLSKRPSKEANSLRKIISKCGCWTPSPPPTRASSSTASRQSFKPFIASRVDEGLAPMPLCEEGSRRFSSDLGTKAERRLWSLLSDYEKQYSSRTWLKRHSCSFCANPKTLPFWFLIFCSCIFLPSRLFHPCWSFVTVDRKLFIIGSFTHLVFQRRAFTRVIEIFLQIHRSFPRLLITYFSMNRGAFLWNYQTSKTREILR